MKLFIGIEVLNRWRSQLIRAGKKEIGGILFAEQLSVGEFRIIEATCQNSRFLGSNTTFMRKGKIARKQVKVLHNKYGGDPKKFNYFGEWHSHPSFPPIPSERDRATMCELIEEQDGAANFLVLLIIKYKSSELQLFAEAYLASGQILECEIHVENSGST